MQSMRIEASVWHAQLYLWGLRLWKTFASSREYIEVSSSTNICQYVRILALAFVAFVGYLIVTVYLGATFIYYPSVYFGWGYWLSVGKLTAFIAAVFLFFFCISVIGSGLDSVRRWRRKKTSVAKKLEALMEGTPDRPSIVSVAKKYVEAQTEGFCASIEIVAPVATGYSSRIRTVSSFDVYVPVREQEDGESLTPSTPVLTGQDISGQNSISKPDDSVSLEEKKENLVLVDYISSRRIKFFPVWWKLVGISMVSALFLYIFTDAYRSTQDIESTWNGECSVDKWENKGSALLVNLTCGGKKVEVTDAETLLSYITNPGNPRCFMDKSGELYCNIQDQKRIKKQSL